VANVDDFEAWLLALAKRLTDTAIGLECLAWAHWVDAAKASTSGLAREFAQLIDDYGAPEHEGSPLADDLLNRQWIQVELPLTLAAISPSLVGTRHLAAARRKLAECLELTIDDGGWRSVQFWQLAPLLLASWTRCSMLARALRFSLPELSPSTRLARATQHWRLALRPDGTPAFDPASAVINGTEGTSNRNSAPSILRTSQRYLEQSLVKSFPWPNATTTKPKRTVAARNGNRRATAKRKERSETPVIGYYAEAGQYGHLQDRRGPQAIRIDVHHAGQRLNLELSAGRNLLISGCWEQELRIDGKLQLAESEWEHVCWHADGETDYLELEMRFESCRLQRQIVLARRHQMVLLADSLTADSMERIDYKTGLPLSPLTRFVPEPETRDGRLVHAGARIPLLPLSLPEWRVDPRSGQLTEVERQLILEQAVAGPAAFFPLILDLSPRRARSQRTWRRLTVAENLRPVPASEAAAFRAESADDHWLIYRELGQRGNRTFFGKNVCCDFYLGRFLPARRDYQTLVEIE